MSARITEGAASIPLSPPCPHARNPRKYSIFQFQQDEIFARKNIRVPDIGL